MKSRQLSYSSDQVNQLQVTSTQNATQLTNIFYSWVRVTQVQ